MAITDFFDRGWRAGPDGIAFIAGDRTFSYREIGELSCRVGNGLLARGIVTEAKGAVLAGNDPVAWACVLGLWRAGMAWVPVNAANPPEDIQRQLASFDCEVLFCHAKFLPVVEKLRSGLPALHTVVFIDGDGAGSAAVGGTTLALFLEGASTNVPALIPASESVAGIMPTRGTTGSRETEARRPPGSMFNIAKVPITRYRYRGVKIPNP